MNKRVWVLLLLFVLWCIGSAWYYDCVIKENCNCCVTKKKENINKDYGPLTFNWDNPDAVTNDKFGNFKNEILAKVGDTDSLNIIGKYFDTEKYSGIEANLGLARAKQAAKLFATDLGGRIKIESELVNWEEGNNKANFNSINFDVIKSILSEGESIIEKPIKQQAVVKKEGKTLVYFDFGSGKKISNIEVTTYLKEIGAELKADRNKIISVVGHTDSKGDAAANKRLGNNRAVKIKKTLIKYGAKWRQIKTSSKGETEPISNNDTEEGRAQNRRVEIIF